MIDKRLFNLPHTKSMLVMLAGLTLLQAFAILFQGIYLAKAIVGSWEMRSFDEIIGSICLFLLAFLVRHLCTWTKDALMEDYAMETTKKLRADLLDKIYNGGVALTATQGTGSTVTTLLDGMDEVEKYLTLIFPKMLSMSITPWILLIYIFTQNQLCGWILLLLFPLIIFFMIILGLAAQAKADKQFDKYILLSNHFVDALRGLPTLKVLGLSKQYSDVVYTTSEDYRKATMSTLRIAILSTFALDFFTTLSIAMIAMFLGLALINGSIPLFPALVVLILSPDYFLPVRDFGNDYHATLNGKNAMGKMFDLLAFKTVKKQDLLPDAFHWDEASTLTTNALNFQYDDTQEGVSDERTVDLENISLTLQGYQKIGIIGPTGSGKTTLLEILAGFLIPAEKADNFTVNGTPLPHMNQTRWQTQFNYIPQNPYIFADTIKNNIKFYVPTASDKQVKQAVKQAGLETFVASLKDGLDTPIGEKGRGISGGQAQRIALARAFLATDRRILLLDEPTAHLDIETEYELKQTMMPLFKDHLVLFATHRLHWLQEMDFCLVIKDGKIVESGTPAELAAKGSEFKQLTEPLKEGILA